MTDLSCTTPGTSAARASFPGPNQNPGTCTSSSPRIRMAIACGCSTTLPGNCPIVEARAEAAGSSGAMAARDQEFTVANVIRVTAGVEIHDFPPFPRGGLLVVLDPPCLVADNELTGYAAEVSPEKGPARLVGYEFWHVNDRRVIGLLCVHSEA